ncbi:MAG: A24 family peptidase [Acetobacteraceae bacterium]|nr:A24 family peptidase [Acetobacteraceae bacterium]
MPLLAAPVVGSFLGVLIKRLPEGRPVAMARSCCEACGAPLGAPDLMPLLSYAALRGCCRRCKAHIAPFHWHVELAAVLVPLTAIAAGLEGSELWAASAAGWLLLALSWIDAEWMLLPDALTLPLLLGGLTAAWWFDAEVLADHALAALAGWFLLWALAALYRRVRGWEGLGAGDAKLLGALGAWVGLAGLADVLLGAALAGLAWAGLLRLRGRAVSATTALPFGPFLALSGWAVLLALWGGGTTFLP